MAKRTTACRPLKHGGVSRRDYAHVRKSERMAYSESAFDKLAGKLAHKPGIKDPAAVAAKIGVSKIGQKAMTARSVAARKKSS